MDLWIIWRRQWHPTPVLLPGKSHGQRSQVGCSPWGRYESDTTERLHFHFSWRPQRSKNLMKTIKLSHTSTLGSRLMSSGAWRGGCAWIQVHVTEMLKCHHLNVEWSARICDCTRKCMVDVIGKDTDAGRDWGQEKRMTEDEKAGWHHWLEWTLGVSDGQGGLACCNSWGRKESDMTEWLNWLNWLTHH